MAGVSFTQLEKQAGRKAALKLRKSLRSLIKTGFETTKGNSEILRSTVLSKMKSGELQRLVIKMPHYGFKNHFGFDGVKSNGVKLRLINHTGFLTESVEASNALETLATEIGEIRADQITLKISF
tara:strand:+ start:693 stop:1067 length:375 start_codon:yes stop_codon:yes gene_type:complete